MSNNVLSYFNRYQLGVLIGPQLGDFIVRGFYSDFGRVVGRDMVS